MKPGNLCLANKRKVPILGAARKDKLLFMPALSGFFDRQIKKEP